MPTHASKTKKDEIRPARLMVVNVVAVAPIMAAAATVSMPDASFS
eukprot:CAMPEP_0198120400 /NCGR_PEP_ID=MMETSP1442-20131203/28923_1 /TAXON_ID= /ORGANISM="Craspedostauros australis, Strain CCMP3328" /LENGTH=44 /DNA_ID= /DNA_START= /DNA_END= /DNA_ORIENTATION=